MKRPLFLISTRKSPTKSRFCETSQSDSVANLRAMCRYLAASVVLLLAVLGSASPAGAAEGALTRGAVADVHGCIRVAAKAFGIEPLPLEVLLKVEAGALGMASPNKDGSRDLGPMQINTVHLETFAKFGITYEDLRDNVGCKNVWAGAYLYALEYRRLHGDVALAIAYYHSRTPERVQIYLDMVRQVIDREIRARQASAPRGGRDQRALIAEH